MQIHSIIPLGALNYNPASYGKEKANSDLHISHSYSQSTLGFVSTSVTFMQNVWFFFKKKYFNSYK